MTIDTQKLRSAFIDITLHQSETNAIADHIDDQAAEIEKLRIQIDGYDGAIAKRDLEIERLRDALREALDTIASYPHSRDQEMGATAMRKVARDALAQHQGEKNGDV